MTTAALNHTAAKGWLGELFYIIGEHKRRFLTGLALGLVSAGFVSAINPLALKYLFDEAIIRKNFRLFVLLSIVFILVFSAWRILDLWCRLYVQQTKNECLATLSLRMLGNYYRLPYLATVRKEGGYFISRIYDEISAAAVAIIDCSLVLFNASMSLIASGFVALILSWRATVVLIFVIPVVYRLSARFGSRIRERSESEKEEEAKLRGIIGGAIRSYKFAKTFDLCDRVCSKTRHQFDRFIEISYSRFKATSVYGMLASMFMSYAEAAVIVTAGYEILSRRMSFGGFLAYMNAFWIVLSSAKSIFEQLPELSRVRGLINRMVQFDQQERESSTQYADDIKLENVSFSLDGKKILTDFSLETRKGERVLVVGPNGIGKSTLAHLIAGFFWPTSGKLTTLPLSRISAVIFPCDFIPGTLMDNIRIDEMRAKKKEALSVLLNEFELSGCIDKAPHELSAGQRKRLEVMLGLLKDADLYIFDEPLAHIDSESGDRIISAILRETADKTLIVVMHKEDEFSDRFDRVVRLTSSGPPEISTLSPAELLRG